MISPHLENNKIEGSQGLSNFNQLKASLCPLLSQPVKTEIPQRKIFTYSVNWQSSLNPDWLSTYSLRFDDPAAAGCVSWAWAGNPSEKNRSSLQGSLASGFVPQKASFHLRPTSHALELLHPSPPPSTPTHVPSGPGQPGSQSEGNRCSVTFSWLP